MDLEVTILEQTCELEKLTQKVLSTRKSCKQRELSVKQYQKAWYCVHMLVDTRQLYEQISEFQPKRYVLRRPLRKIYTSFKPRFRCST